MILVTGGAGFIGSHLVQLLVEAGEVVRVFERPAAQTQHLPLDRIDLVRGDIRDRSAVREAVRGCRHVYHLAANPNLWTRHSSDFEAVNYHGTCHVLHEALAAGAQRVLYTSTESILARAHPGSHAVESWRLSEEDVVGPYCRSKFKGEQEAFRLAETGAPVIVACPTLPIGPGDYNLTPPSRMSLAFCRGELPAYLDCRFNMIDARDIATGLHAALLKGRPSLRYLISGVNLRLVEWLAVLGRQVGREAPRFAIPYPLALAVAYASEWVADHLTHQMPMATVTGVKLTRLSMHFDAQLSREMLKLTTRSVEESARDAVAWFRQQGLLAPAATPLATVSDSPHTHATCSPLPERVSS